MQTEKHRKFRPERGKWFLEFNYAIYYIVIGKWIEKKFNYKAKTFTPESRTFLVIANHANDLDPFFLGRMFPHYIRFVSTESLLRKPFIGPLISFLQRPISRKKGESGEEVSGIIRDNLKNGISVAMLPEGVRTINGKTGFISPRTADLLTDTGAGLITCRIYGAYLCNPIWSRYSRRGRVRAEMVHEYTAEELASMSTDEINRAISDDLAVNAYEVQRSEMLPYPGKNLAEGLENVIYLCPDCKKYDGLKSTGNSYACSCGFNVELNADGFFHGKDLPFDNVCDWETWQRKQLAESAEKWRNESGRYISSENSVNLRELKIGKTDTIKNNAEMTLYSDALEFKSGADVLRYPLSGIDEVSNFRSSALIFTFDGKRFEVTNGSSWPVFKYIALIRLLKGKAYL